MNVTYLSEKSNSENSLIKKKVPRKTHSPANPLKYQSIFQMPIANKWYLKKPSALDHFLRKAFDGSLNCVAE